MLAPYFPDWRSVYRSEHLPGILCPSRNMFSGYIPVIIMIMIKKNRNQLPLVQEGKGLFENVVIFIEFLMICALEIISDIYIYMWYFCMCVLNR